MFCLFILTIFFFNACFFLQSVIQQYYDSKFKANLECAYRHGNRHNQLLYRHFDSTSYPYVHYVDSMSDGFWYGKCGIRRGGSRIVEGGEHKASIHAVPCHLKHVCTLMFRIKKKITEAYKNVSYLITEYNLSNVQLF